MIQRVQTIYLVLAFICVVLLLYFPLFSVNLNTHMEGFENTSTAHMGPYGLQGDNLFGRGKAPIYLLYIGLVLWTSLSILLYKKRKLQLNIARITLILHILVAAGIYGFFYFGKAIFLKVMQVEETDYMTISFSSHVGMYLLVAAIPFLMLAIRGIKNDEKLVKSLDRLR